jgi:hypothetical protein
LYIPDNVFIFCIIILTEFVELQKDLAGGNGGGKNNN